jgi:hypothetical protein
MSGSALVRYSSGPNETERGLTLLQLTMLEEAFTTPIAWVALCKKHGVRRQELLLWRLTPAWQQEWKRREDLVIEEHDRNLRLTAETASRTLIELACGRGSMPRMDKNLNIMGGAPAPVPYAIQLRAAELLLTVGQRGRADSPEAELHEMSLWLRKTP